MDRNIWKGDSKRKVKENSTGTGRANQVGCCRGVLNGMKLPLLLGPSGGLLLTCGFATKLIEQTRLATHYH